MFLRVWLSLFRDDFSTALSIFVNITFKYTHISSPYVEYFSMYHIAGGMILDYLKVLFLNIVTDCFELSSRLINDMGASRRVISYQRDKGKDNGLLLPAKPDMRETTSKTGLKDEKCLYWIRDVMNHWHMLRPWYITPSWRVSQPEKAGRGKMYG